jgi:tetratricopeptide (TPR) repeat protein
MRGILIGLAVALVASAAWAQGQRRAPLVAPAASAQMPQQPAPLVAPAASAQTQQQRDWCSSRKATDDQVVEGCTALIQSGQETAAVYFSRGGVYEHRGIRDQAIADYRAALKINPNLVVARDGLDRLGATP